jgi:hypothetical protein
MIAFHASVWDRSRRPRSRRSEDVIIGKEVSAPVVPGGSGSSIAHDKDGRRHSDTDDCKSQVSEIAVSTSRHFPHPQSVTKDSPKWGRVFGEIGAVVNGLYGTQ